MAELSLYNMQKKTVGSVGFPEIFGKVRPDLIHQVVTVQLANRRRGTSRVKNRHEVTGSTRKIYRQKGTGRARHGDIKAPLFVGGGRAFGPKPRSWRVELPREVRRLALASALAQKGKESKIWVIDSLKFDSAKTKEAVRFFDQFKIESALVVLDGAEATAPAVERSVRNLPRFKVCRAEAVNVAELIRYGHVVFSKAAYEKVLEGFR